MVHRGEKSKPVFVVVDRGDLGDKVKAILESLGVGPDIRGFASVLEVLGESGPKTAAGLIVSTAAAGPFLQDLLRWTDREQTDQVPTLVVGKDSDEQALEMVLGKEHVRWIDVSEIEPRLNHFVHLAIEVNDLRSFHDAHEAMAAQLRGVGV